MKTHKVSWKNYSLDDIAEKVDYGHTASATDKPVGPRFLRITDIQNGAVHWQNVPYCECSAQDSRDSALAAGDIVFARTGATTGKSFLLDAIPEPTIFASYLIRLRLKSGYEPRLLAYYFQTDRYWSQIKQHSQGATLPGVNATKLRCLKVTLPEDQREQRRIAGILDEADTLRRKRAEAIRLANNLVPSLFYEMFGDPRVNIHRWEMLSLAEVVDPNRPITYGILKPGDYEPDGIPMIRIQDIRGSEIDISTVHRVAPALSMQYKRTVLQGVEILISLVGTIGLLTRVSENLRGANVHRNLGVIVPGAKIRRDYLFWLLKASPLLISSAMKGGVQSLLNLGDLEKLRVPVPPVEAQDQFCRVASEGERVVEQCIVTEAELDNLFHSLLQQAFRGEL